MRRPLASGLAAIVAVLAALLVAGCGGGDGASADVPSPRHVVYISASNDEQQLSRLVPARARDFGQIGLYRQMPAHNTPLPPAHRIARVDGTVLGRLDANGIAARLRRAIDGSCARAEPCTSGLVGLDDVADEFRGARGAPLLAAMQQLQGQTPSRGGSYASRVVMYLDWQMLDDLANPRTAGAWSNAVSAAALGNSAWLEMYESTGAGQMNAVPLAGWKAAPTAANTALTGAGMDPSAVHLMIGPWAGTLPGQRSRECTDALACVWRAATATPVNRALVRNGVGIYRYGPAQLADYCTFVWQAEPGIAPDPAVRTDCAHWIAGQLDFLVPGSDTKLN